MTQRTAVTIDADSGTTVPVPPDKPLRLDSLKRVRLELARVYSDARAGRVTTQDATRLAYVLDCIKKCIMDADLEERVAQLEAEHAES